MPYSLEYKPSCRRDIEKACRKNKELRKALENKISGILEAPQRFKPLHFPLQGRRRVHILKSFVLEYEIDERSKAVILLVFCHHDDAYE